MTTFSPPADITSADSELLLIGWIRGMSLGSVVRVVTDLPADLASVLPVVQVTRIGGRGAHPPILDRPRLDVDVFAATRQAASDICRKIEGKLHTLRGQAASGTVITDVFVEQGSSWRPYGNPDVRRFGLFVELTIRRTT